MSRSWDASTFDEPTSEPEPGFVADGLRITIAWHRDPERIGATAWMPWGPHASSFDLSRHAPQFDDGASLADDRISRSPLQIIGSRAGVELWPTRKDQRFDVDGRPGSSGQRVTAEALARGVLVGLGKGALVELRHGPAPRRHPLDALIGRSPETDALAATLASAAAGDGHVLVCGESGTGKELVAHAIHAGSPRCARAFVAVNAAALSANLGASQLFGHTRGAFTGADKAASGHFGEAHRGTLFLDEIGTCPNDVQALLLRALESGEAQVVGGPLRTVDVRVIAATDDDLVAACEDGTFRAPLYHRLAQRVVRLTPLRDRRIDIAVQATHFLREGLRRRGRDWPARGPEDPPWLARSFIEALLGWRWPGNTRELRALIDRTLERDGDAPCCGPPPFEAFTRVVSTPRPSRPDPAARRFAADPTPSPTEPDPGQGASIARIVEVLAHCDYRLSAAAELLGMSRNTLKRRMEAAHLRRPVEIAVEELRAALAREGGVPGAARALRVSEHGLRIRMTQLGLAE